MAEILSDLVTVFEFLSFLASLTIYLKKKPPLFLKFFPIFLLITVVVEVTAKVLSVNKISISALYNFFSAFEIVFYFFVLYHSIQNKRIKQIIFFTGIFYPAFAIINILYQGNKKFHAFTYSLGAILLVCFCIYSIYELLKKTVPQKINRRPAFWIYFGLLFYYSCTLPIWASMNFLRSNRFELMMFSIISGFTNYLLYSSFVIAFLCNLKLRENQ
jgi:hypothetical protein